jgi:hypothetical protein
VCGSRVGGGVRTVGNPVAGVMGVPCAIAEVAAAKRITGRICGRISIFYVELEVSA